MTEQPLVTACIVTWNSAAQIERCIGALLATEHELPGGVEIIVVDNASSDGTPDLVAREYGDRVRLVANDDNRYYASGNNQCFELASGEYILILNPDAYVQSGCLKALLDELLRDSSVGAVAPRLVLPDGSTQRSCRRFPSPWWMVCEATLLRRVLPGTRAFGGYFYGEWDYESQRSVDQPMTSCLLVRGGALRDLAGFDESFEMFFNDVDLCFRMRAAGLDIRFEPAAVCKHDHGASTKQAPKAMVEKSQQGLLRFYEKHYRPAMPRLSYALCSALVRAIGIARLLVARQPD